MSTSVNIHKVKSVEVSRKLFLEKPGLPGFCTVRLSIIDKEGVETEIDLFSEEKIEIDSFVPEEIVL